MALSHEQFNDTVREFIDDVAQAVNCFPSQLWTIEADLADEESERLRAVVDAKVDLRAPQAEPMDTLALFTANYKLCTDSYGDHLAVEHSSFVLKATLDRTPIIRWDYDRDARSKPSSHVQMTAHRGALSHLLSRLDHATPHSIESLHMPMGGDRFRPCLEDIIEFLIRDCGFQGSHGWRETLRSGRAKWRRIQTRAVVRDCAEEAADQLVAMGYTVTPPAEGHRRERTDRLTAW
ncbi:hypothetical protein ACQI4L_09815 [Mycolicibacterium litorale]|uniref:hypothetical protein n=1 Tax=Mycolicibacterium litorale TaxID=758802 RepID=UPI003CEF6172